MNDRNTARSVYTVFLLFWFNFKSHFPYPPSLDCLLLFSFFPALFLLFFFLFHESLLLFFLHTFKSGLMLRGAELISSVA